MVVRYKLVSINFDVERKYPLLVSREGKFARWSEFHPTIT